MDEGNIGCGIFVGLKKPFDTVEYIFLSKLEYYCIFGFANEQFQSLKQKAMSFSQWLYCSLATEKFGVPQASVLNPILFLAFINDLNQVIKFCKVDNFTNDTNCCEEDCYPT